MGRESTEKTSLNGIFSKNYESFELRKNTVIFLIILLQCTKGLNVMAMSAIFSSNQFGLCK